MLRRGRIRSEQGLPVGLARLIPQLTFVPRPLSPALGEASVPVSSLGSCRNEGGGSYHYLHFADGGWAAPWQVSVKEHTAKK